MSELASKQSVVLANWQKSTLNVENGNQTESTVTHEAS